VLGPQFADEIRLVTPPWPVQRVGYALLGPVARLRGLRREDVVPSPHGGRPVATEAAIETAQVDRV
jgi:hypothetical protein